MLVAQKQIMGKQRAKHTKVQVMFWKSLQSPEAFSLPLAACSAIKSSRSTNTVKAFFLTASFSYLRYMPTQNTLPAQLILFSFLHFGHSGECLGTDPQATADSSARPTRLSEILFFCSCLVTHVLFYAVELGRKRIAGRKESIYETPLWQL